MFHLLFLRLIQRMLNGIRGLSQTRTAQPYRWSLLLTRYTGLKDKNVFVSTYRAVSGAGATAIKDLEEETKAYFEGKYYYPEALPAHIAFNVIPHIDVFLDNDYTKEEMKMVNETRKIMHAPDIKVSPTCVRVPVFTVTVRQL